VDGLSLPVAPDDERLWVLGLLGFVVLVVAAAVAWNTVPSGTATVQVTDAGDEAPVTVTVERVDDGRTVVARQTVEGDFATVHRTGEAGSYEVTVDHGDWTCERRFGLVRESRKLDLTYPPGDAPSDCRVGLEVDVSPL
jgi:hypothetical protein